MRYLLCVFILSFSVIYSYERDPSFPVEIWEQLTPYFLPENHPIKPVVDRLFQKSRITLSEETLKEAGFESPKHRRFSHTVVSKHPKVDGYIFKLFTDDQQLDDWVPLYNRILGAEAAKESILKRGYEHFFNAPRKWLYPLPLNPAPPPGYRRTMFVLIAKDLHILKKKENRSKWKNVMSKERLDALYRVLQDAGLSDSVYAFNLPFDKNNKLCFIDTEHHHSWPVPFSKLSRFLSPKLETYWENLIKQGGPK